MRCTGRSLNRPRISRSIKAGSGFIYDSLDKPDVYVEAKWVDESEKRYQAYKEGKIQGVSINEIKSRYKK